MTLFKYIYIMLFASGIVDIIHCQILKKSKKKIRLIDE